MPALRCTQRLLKRLPQEPEDELPPPENRLGDWYANVFNIWRHRLVLCTAEKSLLPVIVPIKDSKNLRARLRDEAAHLMTLLGIPGEKIREEVAGMEAMPVGRTANRRVLGSMNDFAYMAKHYAYDGIQAGEPLSLDALALRLGESPCSPIGGQCPVDATRRAFGCAPIIHRPVGSAR